MSRKARKSEEGGRTTFGKPAGALPEDYNALVAVVDLVSIQLVDTRASLNAEHMPLDPAEVWTQVQRPVELETRGLRIDETDLVYCGIKFGLELGEAEEPPFVEVNAEYCLMYKLPDGYECSDEAIALFARKNAVVNVWPFFREHVQSMVSKMGLPPALLPLYRVPAK